MKRRFLRHGGARKRQAGSTLLVVLALLSVLVLLASTLAFTGRVELMSSRNFSRAVQVRTATLSSLGAANAGLEATITGNVVGPLELVSLGSAAEARSMGAGAPGAALAAGVRVGPLVEDALQTARVADASGRVNLNTADTESLRRLFAHVAERNNVAVDADALARAVVAWRLGPDGVPGEATIDDNRTAPGSLGASRAMAVANEEIEAPNRAARLAAACGANAASTQAALTVLRRSVDEREEYVADLRRPAFGDDRRLGAVEDLLQFDGVSADFVRALAPSATVFSVSLPPVRTIEGRTLDLLDLNRATAEEILAALEAEYGNTKAPALLRQFAVNVVDARDADFIPTVLRRDDGVTLGFERTPVITEVYPDSRAITPEDDGEFIEIHNPWPDSVDLSGWSVVVDGADYPLQGTLAPGGFLILTDNYDRQRPGNEDLGLGSFYDVHGVVPAGEHRRMVEIPTFSLPHRAGAETTVELYRSGDLIDRFVYRMPSEVDTLKSLQRQGDGLVRTVVLRDATPYGLAAAGGSTGGAESMVGPRDVEFTSVLELFEVFAGFDGPGGRGWAFPVLASPASTNADALAASADPGLLDARLIDLFTIETARRPGASELAEEQQDGSLALRALNLHRGDLPVGLDANGRLAMDGAAAEPLLWDRYLMLPRGGRHGLINLNTAGEAALVAAGFEPAAARNLVERRNALLRDVVRGGGGDGVLYHRLSELLVDESIWGAFDGRPCDRLTAARAVLGRVTVNSRAFLLEGQARPDSESADSGSNGPKLRALVAMDQSHPEVVAWSLEY